MNHPAIHTRPMPFVAFMVLIAHARIASAAVSSNHVTATVYVGRHFELRDHDQPVKYVFNGQTRVARVTGSLTNGPRIQRWRLHEGWNLCGAAVSEARFPIHAAISSAFQWNPATATHESVVAGQPLQAGSAVWVKATTNCTVSLVGGSPEPTAATLNAGTTGISSGLEARPLTLPPGTTVWRYNAARTTWDAMFANELSSSESPAATLAAGEAIYVHAEQPTELPPPDPRARIAYFHPDHLGSSSAVTDGVGELIEETAYYPFGAVRNEARLQSTETHYGFTQKEQDRESGLQDFGHRFYHPTLGRWLSPDPLREKGGSANLYAYSRQNPLRYSDPDGARITVTVDNEKKPSKYEITMTAVLINTSSTKFSEKQMAHFAERITSRIQKDMTQEKGKVTWKTTIKLRVVNSYDQVGKDEHIIRIVDKANGAGEAEVGGMIMTVKSQRFTQLHPDQVDHNDPRYRHYTVKNFISFEGTSMHEFGHVSGLNHDDTRVNLMQNGSIRENDNTTVHQDQIHNVWKAYKANALNQRDKAYNRIFDNK